MPMDPGRSGAVTALARRTWRFPRDQGCLAVLDRQQSGLGACRGSRRPPLFLAQLFACPPGLDISCGRLNIRPWFFIRSEHFHPPSPLFFDKWIQGGHTLRCHRRADRPATARGIPSANPVEPARTAVPSGLAQPSTFSRHRFESPFEHRHS